MKTQVQILNTQGGKMQTPWWTETGGSLHLTGQLVSSNQELWVQWETLTLKTKVGINWGTHSHVNTHAYATVRRREQRQRILLCGTWILITASHGTWKGCSVMLECSCTWGRVGRIHRVEPCEKYPCSTHQAQILGSILSNQFSFRQT